jgi:hypothetical protein
VIDTSKVHLPDHGTPTVILLARNRPPVASTVRTVMGISGEVERPKEPAKGPVWLAVVSQVDQPGSESIFVSVADIPRATFAKHPWSIGGGGVSELKEQIEEAASLSLEAKVATRRYTIWIGERAVTRETKEIGVFGMTNADEVMLADLDSFHRKGVGQIRRIVVGDEIRDWKESDGNYAFFPYGDQLLNIEADLASSCA